MNQASSQRNFSWNLTEVLKVRCDNIGLKFPEESAEVLGLIPFFFNDILVGDDSTMSEIVDNVSAQYGWPINPIRGGKVNSDLVYVDVDESVEDRDPPLQPLAFSKLTSSITVVLYDYAITAILLGEEQFICRID